MNPLPVSHTPKAVIYCRISSDKTGAGLGVERQEKDCRELARRLKMQVVEVLSENDTSAYSGAPRPKYERLLEMMRSGSIDAVLALHTDRLHRSLVELEEYVNASEQGSVTTHTVMAGPIDLSTPSGRLVARQLGAVARYEVEHAIERVKAAKLQMAQSGKYLGGQRPFGFEPGRTAIREEEAAVIREIVQRVIDGDSFRTIAVDFNRRGITTTHSKEWNALKVRNVSLRPINTGIVRHNGIDYEANSPAIIPRDQWEDFLIAVQLNRTRSSHPGTFRKHVLNGFVFCGECGQKMVHATKVSRGKRSKMVSCRLNHADTGLRTGCGRVARQVEPIIELVRQSILYRLNSPELVSALHAQKTSAETLKSLHAKQRAAEAKALEISDDYYVHNLLTREQFERAKVQADAALKAINERIESEYSHAVTSAIDLNGNLEEAWENGTLEWRRDIIALLIDKIIVHRVPRETGYKRPMFCGKWRFDPDLVEIKWRA
ncbi:recombinase family protein [Rhodococcus sp. HS-D2]|uniref:recombinase family protein n=1 Tax=Rhodococcus sp. HS-D2 TaxID=1384636 RepID=UPI000AF1545C|nr:recombinase family protein [Rhodococcus sp. HS-D2]